MEDKAIIQTIITIFDGADQHQWQQIEHAMTAKVLIDYTSFVGGEPAHLTSKQITDSWSGFLPGFDRTYHQLSDFKVSINNEMAHVTYIGKADHFINNEIWTVEGTYESDLDKINGHWVLSKLKFNFEKQSGNTDLPAEATNRMKK
jgi:SnoaL-like domain